MGHDRRVVEPLDGCRETVARVGGRLPTGDGLALEVAADGVAVRRVVRQVRLAPHLAQSRVDLDLHAGARGERFRGADRLRLGAREDTTHRREARRDLLRVRASVLRQLPGRRGAVELQLDRSVTHKPEHRVERMRILVLGGTQFLGRHVVDAALRHGHDVTMFNRGQTRPELFPDVEKLRGDRDGDLGALAGQAFDAVVDTSGYVPRIMRATLDALEDVGHYTFVSSVSVYADLSAPAGEDAPVAQLTKETEEYRSEAYGALKALCEDAVRERHPDAFIPRPGLIVGPWDPTGRFTYWPERLAHGGRVLAPAPPDAPAQVVDARDLANWIVDAAERNLAGTFNAVAPPTTIGNVVETCRRVAGADAEIVWVAPEFLVEQQVGEWMELPLWLNDPAYRSMQLTPVERAAAAGLHRRPLEETVRDTLDWVRSGEAPSEPPAGLDREKEQRVLDAWLAREPG
jgi:2'-hydroxyisoflavone reductase